MPEDSAVADLEQSALLHTEDDACSDELSSASDEDCSGKQAQVARRSVWAQAREIVAETMPTLLFTAVGLLFTGELLDHVSRWKAMTKVNELIIMIPIVLNLKGNLEMNLSARLSTAANNGHLDEWRTRNEILWGNLALLQVQATIVSFVAACLSFLLGIILPEQQDGNSESLLLRRNTTLSVHGQHPHMGKHPSGHLKSGFTEFVLVTSSAIASTCLSALVLGSFMCFLVVICRKLKLDPDNIAPPIATCLGDLVTLCILGLVSTGLITLVKTPLPILVCVLLVMTTSMCALYVRRNPHVRELLKEGWTPLFAAMLISSGTGIILDAFVTRYNGFALLEPMITGLPGAVGSVSVSRISTSLHGADETHAISARDYEEKHARPSIRVVSTTLFLVSLPIQGIFLVILHSLGWLKLPFFFIIALVIFFYLSIGASLILAYYPTYWLWAKGLDPDTYALPLHSSMVDVVGQVLLVLCYEFVALCGVQVTSNHKHS